jgi:hypothetical protein
MRRGKRALTQCRKSIRPIVRRHWWNRQSCDRPKHSLRKIVPSFNHLPAAQPRPSGLDSLPTKPDKHYQHRLGSALLLSSSHIPVSCSPRTTWATLLDVASSIAHSKTTVSRSGHANGVFSHHVQSPHLGGATHAMFPPRSTLSDRARRQSPAESSSVSPERLLS